MIKKENDSIVYEKVIPTHGAEYVSFPESMRPEIGDYLRSQGISRLYSHQAEMFVRAGEGESLVITTATASGKTLSFLLPVLQQILENPLTRAIFIYPTKALASDQYRVLAPVLEYFGEGRISAGVYDGDTMPAERSRVRKSANIILTNPEMLNAAFLPNHSKYGFDFIFANLNYIVIDELHSYRGAFGGHLANIFRRMKRICGYYHSDPQFLCSSATIANPVELAEKICGITPGLIERDGSPAPEKVYKILQPPEIKGANDKVYGRYSASSVVKELIPKLVEKGEQFLVFTHSRRAVEVILKESRDRLEDAGFLGEKGQTDKIAGYRGGYTPLERREIERKMMAGELTGLICTNALELGIDIGKLDCTVLVGYPGTRASFWQQTGRAGRCGRRCVNYLILENQPFDQYIAISPDWLFEGRSENAIVDPDNLLIELAHIRAAAAEMPLSLDDVALFPDLGEIIPVLLNAQELKSLAGRFSWAGPAFPAGDYSLRNMDRTRYKLIVYPSMEHLRNVQEKRKGSLFNGKEITEMDESQAFHELHPGAVYLHDGEQYEVLKLDLVSRTALAVPFYGNYYTVPSGTEDTRILQTFQKETFKRIKKCFGDINVNEVISMYKKLQFHNHQNLGHVSLTRPLQKEYDTESTWIEIPENIVDTYQRLLVPDQRGELVLNNHFEGISYAIKNAAMMVTMTEKDDIGVILSNNALIPGAERGRKVSLFIYDKYEGGLGYAEKIYDLMEQIIYQAIEQVEHCPCKDGCPVCVGNYTLDKKTVLWGLKNFIEESESPVSISKQSELSEMNRPGIKKEYSFEMLEEKWDEFCEKLKRSGESGAAFLSMVKKVEVKEERLILQVENSFYEGWLQEWENLREVERLLRSYAICPADMKLEIQSETDWERVKKIRGKLNRRYGKDEI